MKHLPIKDYQWVDGNSELFTNVQSIGNLEDDAETGYIFQVDLHYPKRLHDAHNDYPFCAEKRQLQPEDFDIVKKMFLEKNNDRVANGNRKLPLTQSKVQKLLLTLYDKKKYVLDYRMLKLALKHGLELKKVHKILKFKQTPWIKSYIELNIELRKAARNEFEKEFFKLLINAIFGKTMENLRLRVDIKLVHSWEGRWGGRMLIARPNFKTFKIFDDDLATIELKRTNILMNRPIIVGMCILELSKVTMYKFLYDFLKPKYQENVRVAYTDTDSFILLIKTPNFYKDMIEHIEYFDTSNYPKSNEYGIVWKNAGVPGIFKDEAKGNVNVEFVGVGAKCYAVLSLAAENNVIKRSKGVQKSVVQNKIQFNDFLKCFKQHRELEKEQRAIRSINHDVYSITQKKIVLNPCDDKRFIRKRKSNTIAWGHYKLSDIHKKKKDE